MNVTLTGANFVAGATIATANPDISVSNLSVASATTITATFSIWTTSSLGVGGVTVVTGSGTSNSVSFTVAPEPAISGLCHRR